MMFSTRPSSCRGALLAACLLTVTSVQAQPGGSTSDPPTDGTGLQSGLLFGLPFGGPIDISGDQATAVFPDYLLASPTDNWSAATFIGTTLVDRAPDTGQINGTGGTIGDPPDPGLSGIEDLEGVTVLQSGTEVTLQFLFREIGPPGPVGAGVFFDWNGTAHERILGLLPIANSIDGWVPYANGLGGGFPYTSQAYYDIAHVTVDQNAGTITATITVADTIPTPPPEVSGSPSVTPAWAILLDSDGDPSTGSPQGGFDALLTASYSPGGLLQGSTRTYNGTYFESAAGTPAVSVSGDSVTISFSAAAFGVQTGYRWTARSDLVLSDGTPVGPDDYFFFQTDGTAIVEEPIQADDFNDGTLNGWDAIVQ